MTPSPTILIVVGAHLRAEIADRTTAYWLRDRVITSLASARERSPEPDDVIVCTDVWYLNTDDLRTRPTISLGGPAVNAFTAYLADKLPSALAIEGEFVVQYDTETAEPLAACWGADASGTRTAAEAFATRYLAPFVRAAIAGS